MPVRSTMIACALFVTTGCVAPLAGSPPTPTPAASTSAAPIASPVAPASVETRLPKGPLLWEAKLDPSGAELDLTTQYVIGDANAAKIRPVPTGIEVIIARTGGPTGVSFRRAIPATFVAEMDIRIAPGSDMQFVWRVRSGDQLHLLKVDTAREVVEFVYVDPADWPSRLQPIGPRVPIPALLSGRLATLGIVATAPRYALYVDDRRAAEIEDARLTSRAMPLAFGAFGEHGVATIVGVRVFALPAR